MIIKQITLSNNSHIVASQCLNNKNIVFAYSQKFYQGEYISIIFEQYNYKIIKYKNEEMIKIDLILKEVLQKKNGSGNIFIYELEDGKIVTSINTNIYIYDALTE
jgi:hypothetical protein